MTVNVESCRFESLKKSMKKRNEYMESVNSQLTQLSRIYHELIEAFNEISSVSVMQQKTERNPIGSFCRKKQTIKQERTIT